MEIILNWPFVEVEELAYNKVLIMAYKNSD